MKCIVNWIPLRNHVRSRNTQPHLNKTKQHTHTSRRLTPVARLFLTRLGFEKIFKTQGSFKTQKPALLVVWKGVINPPLQALVKQYFSQEEKDWLTKFLQLFSKKNLANAKPLLKAPKKSRDF